MIIRLKTFNAKVYIASSALSGWLTVRLVLAALFATGLCPPAWKMVLIIELAIYKRCSALTPEITNQLPTQFHMEVYNHMSL